jgi:ABC-type transporter Mla maintaining outer membrane lipid asymmetry ATPase subunit MlaF
MNSAWSSKGLAWPLQLSGGQRQRVAIMQQLMLERHFIILDEPFSGLDPVNITSVALDAFQSMLDERARATEQRNSAQVQQISQEVEEFLKRKQAEMDALRAETAEVKRQALDFSVHREAEEQRLAGLISPFLVGQPNPVTVGNQQAVVQPDAKATQPIPPAPPTKRS